MKIQHSIALVTGANRGIGDIFVRELLQRGASKVYAAARNRAQLKALQALDSRVVPLVLDVTDEAQVAAAAALAKDVTLLINNAGAAGGHGAISAPDLSAARREMEVNYFGMLATSRAFAPALAAHGGTIVNVLSMLSLVTLPAQGTYSASKAAALALTRSLGAELKARGIHVLGALPVQIDTDMGQALPEPRLQPQEVVNDVLDAVEQNLALVYPGALSQQVEQAFRANPQAVQDQLLQMLPAVV